MRYLPGTQLYLSDTRLMDPRHGAWLSPDPLGYVDSPNLYAYARQNPIDFVDPSGLGMVCIPPIERTGGATDYHSRLTIRAPADAAPLLRLNGEAGCRKRYSDYHSGEGARTIDRDGERKTFPECAEG